LPGGRPGLLKLLVIEKLGTPEDRDDDGTDQGGW
jgi:hypothetical protein